jgi:hypothetical protein
MSAVAASAAHHQIGQVASATALTNGYDRAFAIGAGVLVVAIALALALPRPRPAAAPPEAEVMGPVDQELALDA